MTFDELVALPAFSLSAPEKEAALLAELNALTRHHYQHSPGYRRIADAAWGGPVQARTLADVPYLPVEIFKEVSLSSTAAPSMVLRSSGTTGQRPSQITVDAETSDRQGRALVATFRPVLGASRMPLLLIDTRQVISDPAMLTARGAGVLGMMKLGARATFALDEALETQRGAVSAFVA